MLTVDPKLSRLAYRCFPNGCPRDRTCCVGLVVAVSRREIRMIDSLMDELVRVAPHLREDGGYVNAFTDDDDLQIEPRDEAGACPFLFATAGRALCSIHHLALATGRDVVRYKPQSCRHGPLVLQTYRGRLRVTVHPSAARIGCVAPRAELPGQPTMREAFAPEIAELRSLLARGRRRA